MINIDIFNFLTRSGGEVLQSVEIVIRAGEWGVRQQWVTAENRRYPRTATHDTPNVMVPWHQFV